MDFPEGHPGAVQYGNFINYYQFHSAEERMLLLPNNVWTVNASNACNDEEPYLVLDVGCNCGDLTQLLQKFLTENVSKTRPVYVLGVDIDPTLILRAKESNKQPNSVTYMHLDVMKDSDFKHLETYLLQFGRVKFDAICCFSITMWIHLNHGDAGLQKFFTKLCKIAELFVVEPQPWNCYANAKARLKKTKREFPLYAELKWRLEVVAEMQKFIEQDLCRTKIYETPATKWERKICFYR